MAQKKRRKKSGKISSLITNILIVCLCIVGTFCGYKVYTTMKENNETREIQDETKLNYDLFNFEGNQGKSEEAKKSYYEMYQEKKRENQDFVGWIVFDSGLLNLPFVKGATNDTYLRTNFYKQYDILGTPFLDAEQSTESRNMTIYGHFAYYGSDLMFTPLDKLRNQENFKGNETFHLYLDGERRDYDVAAVVVYDIDTNTTPFSMNVYDPESWTQFVNMVKYNSLYNTGVEVSENDNFVTMQTCIRGHENLRTLVIGKETGRFTILDE